MPRKEGGEEAVGNAPCAGHHGGGRAPMPRKKGGEGAAGDAPFAGRRGRDRAHPRAELPRRGRREERGRRGMARLLYHSLYCTRPDSTTIRTSS